MTAKVLAAMASVYFIVSTGVGADAQEVKMPPTSGHTLGAVTGGRFGKAAPVIEQRCIACHSTKVIEDAIAAGKNMQKIQERMEQKGLRLSANERTVLGVFWEESPLKKR